MSVLIVGWLFMAGALQGAGSAASTQLELAAVRFEQKIGATMPLDVVMRDEEGAAHPLSTYFNGKPVVLLFGYARCPQLCSVVANGAVETLRRVAPTVGRDYAILYVSIDPSDRPRDLAGLKNRDAGRYGRGAWAQGWHYVSGSENAVARVASAAGFHFTFDSRTKLYAHPSGFVVLTSGGVVSQYFLGVDFDAKAVAAAIDRAAEGKTGTSVFDLLLACARGTGAGGRYSRLIWTTLDVGVALTVGLLGWGIVAMMRTERRRSGANLGGDS